MQRRRHRGVIALKNGVAIEPGSGQSAAGWCGALHGFAAPAFFRPTPPVCSSVGAVVGGAGAASARGAEWGSRLTLYDFSWPHFAQTNVVVSDSKDEVCCSIF
jgi:hypothetical protein